MAPVDRLFTEQTTPRAIRTIARWYEQRAEWDALHAKELMANADVIRRTADQLQDLYDAKGRLV